jgi:hypothetical protein
MTKDEFKARIKEQMDASPNGISSCHRCYGVPKVLKFTSNRAQKLMVRGNGFIGRTKRCAGCRDVSMSIARNLINFLVKARIAKECSEETLYVTARPFIVLPVRHEDHHE